MPTHHHPLHALCEELRETGDLEAALRKARAVRSSIAMTSRHRVDIDHTNEPTPKQAIDALLRASVPYARATQIVEGLSQPMTQATEKDDAKVHTSSTLTIALMKGEQLPFAVAQRKAARLLSEQGSIPVGSR